MFFCSASFWRLERELCRESEQHGRHRNLVRLINSLLTLYLRQPLYLGHFLGASSVAIGVWNEQMYLVLAGRASDKGDRLTAGRVVRRRG